MALASDSRRGARGRAGLAALALAILWSCGGNPPPQPPTPQPPPALNKTVLVAARDVAGVGIDHAAVRLEPDFSTPVTGVTNANGDVTLFVPTAVQGGAWVRATHPSYQPGADRLVLFPTDHPPTERLILTLTRSAPPTPRLTVGGRRLWQQGRPFVWRGITAFQLLDHYADGRLTQAHAFMDWAAADGYTVLRVLTVLQDAWFDLPPLLGVQHLLALLDDAAARGLYVELVALAGTEHWSREDVETQVTAIGAFAEVRSNTLVEIANENAHPSQHPDLDDAAWLQSLRARIPAGVPVSLGSNCCGQSDESVVYPGGDYITVHLDRSRDRWNLVRRVRELEAISIACDCFVVDDEHIGAAEADESGRRIADPNIHFTFGALSRIFQVGTTFHCEDCLFARVPGSVQQQASDALIAGTRIVDDAVQLAYKNAGWADSPVTGFATTGTFGQSNTAIRVYSGLGSTNVTVALGVTGDPQIAWRGSWHPVETIADREAVRVWRIAP